MLQPPSDGEIKPVGREKQLYVDIESHDQTETFCHSTSYVTIRYVLSAKPSHITSAVWLGLGQLLLKQIMIEAVQVCC